MSIGPLQGLAVPITTWQCFAVCRMTSQGIWAYRKTARQGLTIFSRTPQGLSWLPAHREGL